MNQDQKYYERFSIAQRIEHLLLMISFSILAVTGLAQKFSMVGVSQMIIDILGGIEITRIIHRAAAVVFALEAVYHAIVIGHALFVLKNEPSMLPRQKDAKDAWQLFLHNLGFRKDHPHMARFNFIEKADYWAVIWGLFLMGVTGFMLWNPIATTRFLPGQFIPAAKVAHGAEAVLAVLAVIVWHFYNVHIRRLNLSMLNGKLSREQMEEEHALELEALISNVEEEAPSPAKLRKRRSIYFPIAGVVATGLVIGIFFFATFEETAIKTIPPQDEEIVVFLPQTATPASAAMTAQESLPSRTSAAVGEELTWVEISPLFNEKCVTCHHEMSSYEDITAIQGWIVAGNAEISRIVEVQLAGDHIGQFTDDQLARVVTWIDAGAQRGTEEPSGPG